MVNASKPSSLFLKLPTAVQFPDDVHDTELKYEVGELLWIPLWNTAGRASAHVPFVDVMVNASVALALFANNPTAVQFPGEAHDTEYKPALRELLWIPLWNTAARAGAHVPFVDVMVNA
jgi:hypothetical protein